MTMSQAAQRCDCTHLRGQVEKVVQSHMNKNLERKLRVIHGGVKKRPYVSDIKLISNLSLLFVFFSDSNLITRLFVCFSERIFCTMAASKTKIISHTQAPHKCTVSESSRSQSY